LIDNFEAQEDGLGYSSQQSQKSCGVYRVPQIAEAYKRFYSVSEFPSVQSQITSILLKFDFELIAKNDFDYF